MQIKKEYGRETTKCHREGELCTLTFPILENTGAVTHLFSTRLGGVSQNEFASMNLSYTRGDQRACVDENFRRIAAAMGSRIEDFVFTDQTHTANVRIVTGADRGKGILRERDYRDVDGLVTNETGVVLCAFFADCVPLYFVDPVRRVIGLSHSGWRGTVKKIGKVTVETMAREFGSHPEDIVAAIGPSICGSCYEVSEDVAEQFSELSAENEMGGVPVLRAKGEEKYLLNLWEANRRILVEAGIPDAQIAVTDICTCCNPKFLFSHRASHGKRGNLGAFLTLKP